MRSCTFAQRPDMTRMEIKIISFDLLFLFLSLRVCFFVHSVFCCPFLLISFHSTYYEWYVCAHWFSNEQIRSLSPISWFSLRLLSPVPSTKKKKKNYNIYIALYLCVRANYLFGICSNWRYTTTCDEYERNNIEFVFSLSSKSKKSV